MTDKVKVVMSISGYIVRMICKVAGNWEDMMSRKFIYLASFQIVKAENQQKMFGDHLTYLNNQYKDMVVAERCADIGKLYRLPNTITGGGRNRLNFLVFFIRYYLT